MEFQEFNLAANYIARLTNKPEYSFKKLVNLANDGRLDIYFQYRGDIDVTWESAPDGSNQAIGTIPFDGIVKLCQKPTTSDTINEFGIAVSLVLCHMKRYSKGQKYHPPIQGEFSGEITDGYTVTGLIAEADIPRSEWMVLEADIDNIIEKINISNSAYCHQVNTESDRELNTTAEPPPPPDAPAITTASDPAPGTAPPVNTGVADDKSQGTQKTRDRGWVIKKAALIEKHECQWPTIKGDFHSASENGLSKSAKATGHGDWFEADALDWARQRGKFTEEKQQIPVNSIFSIAGTKHTMEG